MQNKIKFIPIIFFLFICFVDLTHENQKLEWKGRIEIEDGVKVIKNPREPLYGKLKFELEEDLSIGREDDKNYMFFRVRGISLDSQENIYITDWGNYRIQKFDKNGAYLQTIGRQGEGPGEFQWTMQLKIDERTGEIYVKDGVNVIEKFDKQGNHLEKIKLEKPMVDFDFDGKGNFFAIQRTISEKDLSKTLCKANAKGEVIENYAKFPYEIFYQRRGEMETIVERPFAYDLFLSKIDDQRFVYGYPRLYELNIIDNDGRLLFKVRKDEPYKHFSGEEEREYRRYKLPSFKPFFFSIITDSKGRVYVQKNSTRGEEWTVNRDVDVFSKDGYYLYESTIPRGTYIIKDGFFYVYFMNEDTGEELVKRLKIRNWEKIKEGIQF